MQDNRNKYAPQKGNAPDEITKKIPIVPIDRRPCAGEGAGPHRNGYGSLWPSLSRLVAM
jgi:hypothetical protein